MEDAEYDELKRLQEEGIAMEAEARTFIEGVLGKIGEPDDPLQLLLADGVVLCNLLNAIKPGACKAPSPSANPVSQRRNIEWFLKAASELGVPPHHLFEVADLYDGKHMRGVLAAVHAVGLIAAEMPSYKGPDMGGFRTSQRRRSTNAEQADSILAAPTSAPPTSTPPASAPSASTPPTSTFEGGAGCYLTFSSDGQGTLGMRWSDGPVDGALAYFKPNKPVPRFKFTQNAGRSDIVRECGGPNKAKFFAGVAQFVKAARANDAELTHLRQEPARPVAIYFNDNQLNVVPLAMGSPFARLHEMESVAVLNESSAAFNCLTLERSQFLAVGNRDGAALAL